MFGDIFDGEVSKESKTFVFGSYHVQVVCVAGENQHLEKWVPLVVWRAAEAFGNELALTKRKEELVGKKIVELGSGTGLCGLLAAQISGNVTLLTDGSDDSVEALEESIGINKLDDTVSCKVLQWGDLEAARNTTERFGFFDICLATDVIYEAAAVRPLLTSANELLNATGKFFFANHRFRFMGLLDEIEKHLKDMPSLKLEEVTRVGNDVDLYILRKSA
jgi:predicted nicotinamide N-methyase